MNFQTAHLIASIQTCFRNDERLLYFFFHHMNPELRLPADELLCEAQSLSRGEYVLIQAALDLWNGEGGLRMTEAMNALDDDNFLALVRAILYFRGVEFTEYAQC